MDKRAIEQTKSIEVSVPIFSNRNNKSALGEGQTVASSYSTPTLFIIAKDLTDMQVVANVDEADISGIIEGFRTTLL